MNLHYGDCFCLCSFTVFENKTLVHILNFLSRIIVHGHEKQYSSSAPAMKSNPKEGASSSYLSLMGHLGPITAI